MNHQIVSFIKSALRIVGCLMALFFGVGWLIWLFLIAEIFGVIEELV